MRKLEALKVREAQREEKKEKKMSL